MRRIVTAVAVAAGVVAVLPWFDFMLSVANRPVRIATIISHRGNGFGHPENTVAAVEAATAAGVPVEVDVRLSKDGTPFLLHDSTVDRTTPCSGLIADKTDLELASCGVDTLADTLNLTMGSLEVHPKVADVDTLAAVGALFASVPPERVSLFVRPTNDVHAAEVAARFANHTIFWSVPTMKAAKAVWPAFKADKDVYAMSMHQLWSHPGLLRWVTQRTQKLNVYFPCDRGCLVKPNRWMVMGMPITHAEVDNPREFESSDPSPTMPAAVYRASSVGLAMALAIGWALGRWTQRPAYAPVGTMGEWH